MTATLRCFSLIMSFLLFTACFEIREEFTLAPDRSGTYAMVFEFTNPALAKLANEANNEPTEGADGAQFNLTIDKNPEQMSKAKVQLEELGSRVAALEIKGISEMQVFSAEDNLSFGYRFSFENLKALNEVLDIMRKEMNEDEQGEFRFPGLHFEKTAITATTTPRQAPAGEQQASQEGQDFLAAFGMEMPTYAIQFVVPKKIKSVSNSTTATLSVDRKTLTIRVPMDGKTSGENAIRYR